MRKQEYGYQGVTLEKATSLLKEYLPYDKSQFVEEVFLIDALARVAAQDYISPVSQPPFDRSPLDGYALVAEDTYGASLETPVSLLVTEEVMAGDFPSREIKRGMATRIMTGAPIPVGADCIIRQEDTDYGDNTVAIYRQMEAYENYCYKGEDFKAGECLIKKDTCLTAIEIGILASMGYKKIFVYKKPRIGLFTTGDELVMPGEPLKPGKIYNSNLFVLWGRLKELGAEPVIADNLPDTEDEVAKVLSELLEQVDIIITTGGVSVGKKDIMHGALDKLNAKKIFWRVLMKPGTPTIFAVVKGVPVISLSGNPFGAITNLELLVRPVLFEMTGNEDIFPTRKTAIMQDEYAKPSMGMRFIRGMFQDGKVYQPKGLQSSGVLGSMQGCNCLIEIQPNTQGLKPGDSVEVVLI